METRLHRTLDLAHEGLTIEKRLMLRFDHIVPPPVAFYFNVTFEGLIETSFQEVSGLQLEMETETIKEGGGGENSFFSAIRCLPDESTVTLC